MLVEQWWSVCLALSVALLPEVYADDSMYRWYPISVASGTPTAASQGSFMGYDGPPHNVNGDERLIVADSSSTWAFKGDKEYIG